MESYCFAMVKEKDYLMNDDALFDVHVFSFLMYYHHLHTRILKRFFFLLKGKVDV